MKTMAVGLSLILHSFLLHAEMIEQKTTSVNGVVENCFYPERIFDFQISDKQKSKLDKLCQLDPYGVTQDGKISVRMCPKLISSSPSLYFLNNDHGYSQEVFQQKICSSGRNPIKNDGDSKIKKQAKFKISLGYTKANASVMYYYLSNMLTHSVEVPVAVFRTLDYREHKKITQFANAQIQKLNIPSTQIIAQSWAWLLGLYAEATPPPALRASDNTVFGILVDKPNAIQYVSIAQGPAVTSEKATEMSYKLVLSIDDIHTYYHNLTQEIQAVVEGAGIADMFILDFLLNQKDRYGAYGNIHFIPKWIKLNQNEILKEKATIDDRERGVEPAEIAVKSKQGYILVKEIALLDNDGAIKTPELNANRKLDLLNKMKHLNPKTYRDLLKLNSDLQNINNADEFKKSFVLTDKEMKSFLFNLKEASQILKARCLSGHLKLDLDLKNYLKITDEQINCE